MFTALAIKNFAGSVLSFLWEYKWSILIGALIAFLWIRGNNYQEKYEQETIVHKQERAAHLVTKIENELVGFQWPIAFKFLRDDLVDANLVTEIGDFIMWNNGYWEIDNTNANQLFVGKDPNYPYYDDNGNNPLNPGLENFGYNVSIVCTAHYVPADRLNIIKQRL